MKVMLNKKIGVNKLSPWFVFLVLGVCAPVVCVIWFMFGAIENERLASSKRLEIIYKRDADRAVARIQQHWDEWLSAVELRWRENGIASYPAIVTEQPVLAALAWSEGQLLYPQPVVELELPRTRPAWRKAQLLEFQKNDATQALQLYLALFERANFGEQVQLVLAIARCYYRLGQWASAFDYYERLLQLNNAGAGGPEFILSGLIRGLEIALEQGQMRVAPGRIEAMMAALIELLDTYSEKTAALNSQQRLYMMQRLLAMEAELKLIYPHLRPFVFKTYGAEALANSFLAAIESGGMAALKSTDSVMVLHGPDRNLSLLIDRSLFERAVKEVIAEHVDGPHLSSIRASAVSPNNLALPDGEDARPIDATVVLYEKALSGVLHGFTIYLLSDDSNYFDRENMIRFSMYIGTASSIILLLIVSSIAVLLRVRGQERINQLKSDVISTVSHELKTPLSSVKLLVENITDERALMAPHLFEYVTVIGEENERLTRLVNNFLEYTQVERDITNFDFVVLDAESVLFMAMSAIKHKFDQACVDFHYVSFIDAASHDLSSHNAASHNAPSHNAPSNDVPSHNAPRDDASGCAKAFIFADKDKLCIALINLLENAYKYTGEHKSIELSLARDECYVYIRVRDNGVGLSAAEQKKIFDRFYRVDQRLSRSSEGCGLGLYIAKNIVDKHNGELVVCSKAGQGSEFSIKLPIYVADTCEEERR
ncbi:ATP-binding protein [Agaribacterium haliotis]|uniref:ATP-binding protein n=1 Tax=Agaribacterium haliotis TaxID=2013869 RepID=UPI000BB55FB1|nr:ATP-binding protein [Agaribacterium haliotis]